MFLAIIKFIWVWLQNLKERLPLPKPRRAVEYNIKIMLFISPKHGDRMFIRKRYLVVARLHGAKTHNIIHHPHRRENLTSQY